MHAGPGYLLLRILLLGYGLGSEKQKRGDLCRSAVKPENRG